MSPTGIADGGSGARPDPSQRVVDVVDRDRDHRPADELAALRHAAADVPGLARHPLIRDRAGGDNVVSLSGIERTCHPKTSP